MRLAVLAPHFVLACVLAVACTRSAAPAPRHATVMDDCTLTTKLVPGVPGSPGHLLPSELNPNGASELATVMRTMQSDLTAARAVVLDGGAPGPMFARHRKMRCAWPTDPADRSAQFDAFAQSYLATVQVLDEQKTAPAAAFDNVLAACHMCHDNSCPGPLVVIDGLRITPLDAGTATRLVQQ